ncbi:lysophospholipid acyltransferase family protein [Geotoga petraea]|uniref:1-acyl-sn-glycerol-3-phosphate acyltransferase n=1 Tax=Geotoga petraea TaxID=28234 RepID=A0A1G6M4W8_9BACT|nr:lysophospholipid acyltransferase family protein [Geotoga petraea]TGG87514.1 1-acyl-sn-glycerol-3-phosphate acyltransferase [Geotoga petraea]SDC50364.1 1-acyl-sn-glycerol-3-phosphate acyltransferase [Geotoga petraea]
MSLVLNMYANLSRILPKSMRVKITNNLMNRFLDKYAEIKVINKDMIEKRKGIPTVYIGNHLSNIDGVILNNLLKDNDVAFIAGKKLSENTMTKIILEIAKKINISPNSPDKKAISEALNYLNNGGSIFIFPEGTRSRTGSMIKAKKGFLLLAKMSKAEIVPVGIQGTEKLLPINDDDMSKESFNYSKIKVNFGEPFELPMKTKENRQNWKEIATDYSMRKIAELLDPEYRGEYK